MGMNLVLCRTKPTVSVSKAEPATRSTFVSRTLDRASGHLCQTAMNVAKASLLYWRELRYIKIPQSSEGLPFWVLLDLSAIYPAALLRLGSIAMEVSGLETSGTDLWIAAHHASFLTSFKKQNLQHLMI